MVCNGTGEDTNATQNMTTSDYANPHPSPGPPHSGKSPKLIAYEIDYEGPQPNPRDRLRCPPYCGVPPPDLTEDPPHPPHHGDMFPQPNPWHNSQCPPHCRDKFHHPNLRQDPQCPSHCGDKSSMVKKDTGADSVDQED